MNIEISSSFFQILTDEKWQIFAINDDLQFGNDDGPGLVKYPIIGPMRIQAAEYRSDAVMFSSKKLMESRQRNDLIRSTITGEKTRSRFEGARFLVVCHRQHFTSEIIEHLQQSVTKGTHFGERFQVRTVDGRTVQEMRNFADLESIFSNSKAELLMY